MVLIELLDVSLKVCDPLLVALLLLILLSGQILNLLLEGSDLGSQSLLLVFLVFGLVVFRGRLPEIGQLLVLPVKLRCKTIDDIGIFINNLSDALLKFTHSEVFIVLSQLLLQIVDFALKSLGFVEFLLQLGLNYR